MNDLDELITTSLRERAAGQIDPARLLSGATARGRSRRLRRRVAVGAALATTVAITIGVVATGPRWWGALDRGPDVGASPEADPGPLPEAPGVPGAADRPDLVGTDPNLLHFDAPTLTATAPYFVWTSAEGYEQLEVGLSRVGRPTTPDATDASTEEAFAHVMVGTDRAIEEVVSNRNPAQSVTGVQLAPGVWLRIEAPNGEFARIVADAVRLDRAQRCIVPFQLTARPNGAIPTTCYVGFVRPDVEVDGVRFPAFFTQGGVTLEGASGSTMAVQARGVPPRPGRESNHTSGGRPAILNSSHDVVELLGFPDLSVIALIGNAYQGFSVADADLVLGGLVVASEAQRFETWPGRLVAG